MTTKAKTYLYQIQDANARIKIKADAIEVLRAKATRVNPEIKERVQSSGCGDILAAVVAEIADTEKEWAEQIQTLERIKKRIMGEIETLDDVRYVTILKYRYVDGMTFENIAVKMGVSFRHVTRLHGHALVAFEEKVLKNKKSP